MKEARCDRCGGTFNPTGEEDTFWLDGVARYEHYERDDGEPCGGFGPIVGEWHAVDDCTCTVDPDEDESGFDPGCPVHGDGESVPRYPDIRVTLIGEDGNAFAIVGNVTRALRRAGVPSADVDRFMSEATAGTYDDLLATVMRWVEVA